MITHEEHFYVYEYYLAIFCISFLSYYVSSSVSFFRIFILIYKRSDAFILWIISIVPFKRVEEKLKD